MKTNKGISRRDLLKLSGAALGGLALSGTLGNAMAASGLTKLDTLPSTPLEQFPKPGQMRLMK